MAKKIKKTFICPHCKKEQTSVIEWQKASIAYNYDLKTQEYNKEDEEFYNIESYNCPECEEEIDYDLIKKFYD